MNNDYIHCGKCEPPYGYCKDEYDLVVHDELFHWDERHLTCDDFSNFRYFKDSES